MGSVNQPHQFFLQGQGLAPHPGARPHVMHEGRPYHPNAYPTGGYVNPRGFYGGAMAQQPPMQNMGWQYGAPFEGPAFPTGPMFKHQMRYMRVPANAVGTIIGRNGDTIRDLQQRSGAVIHLDPGGGAQSEEPERVISISGSEAAAKIAQGLIEDVVLKASGRFFGPDRRDTSAARTEEDDGVGGTSNPISTELGAMTLDDRRRHPQGHNSNGEPRNEDRLEDQSRVGKETDGEQGESSQNLEGRTGGKDEVGISVDEGNAEIIALEMSIPDAKVGMVIGKKGATIKQLQQQSRARIAVSKEMDASQVDRPRVVRITGMRSHVEMAQRLILEKVDRCVESFGQEGSDGNGGDVADADQTAPDFSQAGFSRSGGGVSELGQLHAMGIPVSPMGITQIAPYGRGVGLMPGMLRQNVDPRMENRYAEERYFDGAYPTAYDGSGPSDALPGRVEVAAEGEERGTSDAGDTQEEANKTKIAVTESLTNSRESENEER